MQIKLYNTLSSQVEVFQPVNNDLVKMYTCGPTVYDRPHIGNLRSILLSDIVRRTFELEGYEVIQVINITDIGHISESSGEDKMTIALKRHNMDLTVANMLKVAEIYTEQFVQDIKSMNIKPPTHMPRASQHIQDMITVISNLINNGFTYQTDDGIYFDVSKYKDYGALGGVSDNNAASNIRILNTSKHDHRDFALWKFDESGWDTPFGKGFPGWHIECTAMSYHYLGEEFDIHTGGKDLAFIHHNNEIAQANCAFGKQQVRYWLHNEFVLINNEKMSKSLGNHITLEDVANMGMTPIEYRFWLLQTHYRSTANFSKEAIQTAKNSYQSLKDKIRSLEITSQDAPPNQNYINQFKQELYEDFNTPNAIAVLFDLINDKNIDDNQKYSTVREFDNVLGLNLEYDIIPLQNLPEDISALVQQREEHRKNRNWEEADTLREKINKMGYSIMDTSNGPKIYPLSK